MGFRLPAGIDVDELEQALLALAGDAELAFYGHEVAYRASRSTLLIFRIGMGHYSDPP